jgi:hypothetical protein
MAALAADGPRRRQEFSAAATSVNPSAACVHPDFETAGEATHSIGSSRDLLGQCETRTESEVGRAARQIRGLQAVDLPVPHRSEKSMARLLRSLCELKQKDRCCDALGFRTAQKARGSGATAAGA